MNFEIRGDYIELSKLLKATDLVGSGGEGKHAVASGLVKVDGQVEIRKGRKIRPGTVVEFEGEVVRVTGDAT
mgnify:CR=1 FL=1